jgi:hypothetical protein
VCVCVCVCVCVRVCGCVTWRFVERNNLSKLGRGSVRNRSSWLAKPGSQKYPAHGMNSEPFLSGWRI